MFEVICTGINKNYGEKGEKRLISDSFIAYCLKNNIVENNVKYVGGFGNKGLKRIEPNVGVMLPIKKVNVEYTINMQLKSLESIKQRIDSMIETNKMMMKLINEVGKCEKI